MIRISGKLNGACALGPQARRLACAQAHDSAMQIASVSRRLLELHALLGGGGDISSAAGGSPARLACICCARAMQVVERQPSLLLLDEDSPLANWAALDPEELADQIQARVHTCARLCCGCKGLRPCCTCVAVASGCC